MGSLKRKMERKKKLRELKNTKKSLKSALNATLGLPTSCSQCCADFDPVEDADSWMVVAQDQTPKLFCPSCYSKI